MTPDSPKLTSQWIEPQALDIVKRLQSSGFTTYLVGGCVRDLLVGISPKDYDIVTSAEPEDVRQIIKGSHIIGKRFRLVLARRGPHVFEIATFRSSSTQSESQPGEVDENIYGEPEEDACRRDFTINGLFYDPIHEELIDFTHGIKDIKSRTLRMIGDPLTRIKEDPVRVLRALRLSHKLGFSIETSFRQAIINNTDQMALCILPRVREEWLKVFKLKRRGLALIEAYDLGILGPLAPTLVELFESTSLTNLFLRYWRVAKQIPRSKNESTDLFSTFVFCWMLATNNETPRFSLSESDNEFLKTELGMHRVEMEVLTQALSYLKLLYEKHRPEDFKTKHLNHLIRHRALPLALRLARVANVLSDFEYQLWKTMIPSEKPTRPAPRGAKKGRRRRPKNKL